MAEKQNFSDLGRVEAIKALFEGTGYLPFRDLSFEAKAHETVLTASKVLLEGIDFNLVYFPLKHLGYKSVIAVTGELYAQLANPEILAVSLGISAKLDFPQISELWRGIVAAAREHGYVGVSLDLAPSKNGLSISLSATGRRSKAVTSRRPVPATKDLICVSGRLGAAYLGQQLLEREMTDDLEKNRMLVGAFLRPELPCDAVTRMEKAGLLPSAGYFVTRGLSDAVLRLVRDTGLGAKIYAEKIPFEGNSFNVGKQLDIDPVSAAMNGGDDFQLLFTVPILSLETLRKEFPTFEIIGHLALEGVGSIFVLPTGAELPITAPGWKNEQ